MTQTPQADDPALRARVGLVLTLVFAVTAVTEIPDGDLPWLIRSGQETLRLGRIATAESFSFTALGRTLHHEYLTEVVLAWVYDHAGVAGLTALQVAVTLALAVALSNVPDRAGRTRPFAGLSPVPIAVAVVLLRELVSVRAQSFSNAFTAMAFAAVLCDQRGDRWALPMTIPLGLLWTQLHGGNPDLTALLSLGALASPSRRRVAFAAAAAALTCAGPYGARVHLHYLHGSDALHLIKEWLPLWTVIRSGNYYAALCFGFALLAVAALASRARRGERPVFEALAMALYLLASLRYARMLNELVVVSGAVLARSLADVGLSARRVSALATAASGAVVAAALLASPRGLGVRFGGRYPPGAIAWLRQHNPPGPMFNSYNLGGWLILFYPRERVFIDGRGPTAYSDRSMIELQSIYARPERFEALQARYGFRLAVLQPTGAGASLLAWMRTRREWTERFADDRAVIFTRETSPR